MQRNRGNTGDPFSGFGGFGDGFGEQRNSMLSNFFGGKDPFDDPFFQNPFRSMFGPMGNPFTAGPPLGLLEQRMPQPTRSRGPIIEELNSDDEEEKKKEKEMRDNPRKHGRSSNGPYVEDPDDAIEGRTSKQLQYMNNVNWANNTQLQPQTHIYTFQSSTVTCGGVDGAYYTSSKTRRTGSDGLTFEESKEADTTSGQASHRISRGINDKGHIVDRKRKSDGRVDTMQMLHNINEDELSGFNEAWNGNASKHLPGWNQGLNVNNSMGQIGAGIGNRWALPSTEPIEHSGNARVKINEGTNTSRDQQNPRKMKLGFGNGTTSSQSKSGNPY